MSVNSRQPRPLKVLSQSSPLYYLCSSLQSRLLAIHGFRPFFERAGTSEAASHPVTQLWDIFSLGAPLCFLFNCLSDTGNFPRIELPSQHDHDDHGYLAKFAISRFVVLMKESFREFESFTFDELLDRTTTDGLSKTVKAVNLILNSLSTALEETSLPKPSSKRRSSARMSRNLTNPFEHTWNTHVAQLLQTERQYISDLEMIQDYSNDLMDSQTMDAETIQQAFPRKFFTFQRKHRIHLEYIAVVGWQEQRWGRHFIENEADLSITYQIFCVNTQLAFAKLSSNLSWDSFFIDKPYQRLQKYASFLESILSVASAAEHPHLTELQTGYDAMKKMLEKVDEARKFALSKFVIETLLKRIGDDTKGLDLDASGFYILSGSFWSRRQNVKQHQRRFYLFEKLLLCCEETIRQPSSPKVGRKKYRPLSPARDATLRLDRITLIAEITGVYLSEESGDPSAPQVCELTLDSEADSVTMVCETPDQLRRWKTEIDRLRQTNRGRQQYLSPLQRSDPTFFATSPPPYTPHAEKPNTLVKVHYETNIYCVAVPTPVEYEVLVDRVEKKLRICYPQWPLEQRPTLHVIHRLSDATETEPLTPGIMETTFIEGAAVSLVVH
ncbi:hypothetical protein C8J56DRAFT_376627 [Mycena floridula]|nr:hypothetical protein C8J56DRAFT_376627 [Mycena floridula]